MTRGWLPVAIIVLALPLLTCMGEAGNSLRITKEELRAELGDPNLSVIDVRVGKSWRTASSKIKSSVREAPSEVESWYKEYPKSGKIVLYCS